MKLNADKCHLLMAGCTEQMWATVGDQKIWESNRETLLGVTIDKELKFCAHLKGICKTASGKVTALGRLARLLPFERKRVLMNSFVESQFSCCPLVWMFCPSVELNRKINRIQERALRIVYLDYTSSYGDLLGRDGSVTIHQRNIQLVAIEMFKVKNGVGPTIVRDLFSLNGGGSRNDFFRPNVNTEYMGKLSIRYFGPLVWDSMLPAEFKSVGTLKKFKKEIRKWIPVGCPCRLCKNIVHGVGFIETFE